MVDADPMVHPTQMQVYLRRWRPSSYTVDPIQEMILDENTLEHLRKKVRGGSENGRGEGRGGKGRRGRGEKNRNGWIEGRREVGGRDSVRE